MAQTPRKPAPAHKEGVVRRLEAAHPAPIDRRVGSAALVVDNDLLHLLHLPNPDAPVTSMAQHPDFLFDHRAIRTYYGLAEVHPDDLSPEGMLPVHSPFAMIFKAYTVGVEFVTRNMGLAFSGVSLAREAFRYVDILYYMYCMGYVKVDKTQLMINSGVLKSLQVNNLVRLTDGVIPLYELTERGLQAARGLAVEIHTQMISSTNHLHRRMSKLAATDRTIRAKHNATGIAEYPVVGEYPLESVGRARIEHTTRGLVRHRKAAQRARRMERSAVSIVARRNIRHEFNNQAV